MNNPLEVPQNTGGVYILYDNGACVYIGQAKDIRGRITQHFKDKSKAFDSFTYYAIDNPIDRTWLEKMLLSYIRPKYNKQLNNNALNYRITYEERLKVLEQRQERTPQ